MDRMLVQRGLSFRGPHHGKHGATDELIAAAEARLAAGIISKEPAIPDEPSLALQAERAAAAGRHGSRADEAAASGGRMLWPQYGVTADIGSYGPDAACDTCARPGATVVALDASEPLQAPDGRLCAPTQPVQVNPTASISGLLDKLTAINGVGRATGRALTQWERLARDSEATIALTLSTPVIAEGLREVLVYAVEHRYVDVVVASADDLFADVYEALGFAHYQSDGEPLSSDEGIEHTRTFVAEFLETLDTTALFSVADFWRRLGEALPTRAPRKGLLQAAAGARVEVFSPDLSTSTFGAILLAAQARGRAMPLNPAEDVATLARVLADRPRLGIVQVGDGAAQALLAQARAVAPALGIGEALLTGSVTIGATRPLASGEHHVTLATDTTLALPLLVTGLAQRVPGKRQPVSALSDVVSVTAEEPALA
jgi:deoxyhypusine synthase